MKSKKLTGKEYEELIRLRREVNLPHLYGWKWYSWAKKFFDSTNRFNFLCAANQISKSSTQIRKAIHWATCTELWPKLWHTTPTQFFYLYPTRPVATGEFYEKWVPEFLPRGEMKKDSVYGWEEEIKNKEIHAVHFNSGVSIYFKTYEQDTQHLQTATCYAIFGDEELPFEHFNELRSRLIATNGYFHMVFTATLGQDEWRRTMEPENESEELFKDALKLQISMYDCLTYIDGTPSFWTPQRIKEVELECATEAEVQKRVFGKFVVSGGLKCPGFNRVHNMAERQAIPPDWAIYTGVDVGSGGEKGHPACIAMVAVRPDYKFGLVFKGWRGDGIQTSNSDILEKHTELCTYEVANNNGEMMKRQFYPVLQSYDWQAKDFEILATRAGVAFSKADKRRTSGEGMLNTLFKLRMLSIMDEEPELGKLVVELTSLKQDTPKARAKDDFYDALRYAIMPIPWDFEGVAGEILKFEEERTDGPEERTNKQAVEEDREYIESELDEWQDLIDGR